MEPEMYIEEKWKALFKLYNFSGTGVLTLAEFMEYPCQLLREGKVDGAIVIANVFKKVWESQLEAIGRSKEEISMNEEDFVKSQNIISQQDWYHDDAVPSVASAFFDSLDENKDGLISLAEWRHHYERHGVKNEDLVGTTFAKMDSNNDGFISGQEFEYALKMFFKHDLDNDYSFLLKF